MRKRRKIVLGVVVVILVSVIGLLRLQWNNVQALAYLVSLDREGLQGKIEENEKNLQGAMSLIGVESFEVSPDQLEQLKNGAMNAEEIANQVLQERKPAEEPAGETIGEADVPTSTAPGGTSPSTSAPKPDKPASSQDSDKRTQEQIDNELSVQVATMYVLKARFVSQLEDIVNSAKADFLALPEDQRTAKSKKDIVYSYVSQLTQLEKECDTQVAAVVDKVRGLLAESGRDLSLADQIQETYEQEKSLKKAFYINELNS